jgi:hypothetical protein
MYRRAAFILSVMAALCLAVTLPACSAVAQQKQQVSFKAPAENSKYTQQLIVDVGDVPNHIVRAFEIRFTYPNNAPVINGSKVVETWGRGITDYIDGNGSLTVYNVIVMENGDKVFARLTGVTSNTSAKLTATQVGYITGGSGKFVGVQGTVRISTNFDYKAGFNESQFDIEYSMGK